MTFFFFFFFFFFFLNIGKSLYKSIFEDRYLDSSRVYYANLSEKFLDENDASEWLKKVRL